MVKILEEKGWNTYSPLFSWLPTDTKITAWDIMKLQTIYNKVELKMTSLLEISVYKEITRFPDELGRSTNLPVLQKKKRGRSLNRTKKRIQRENKKLWEWWSSSYLNNWKYSDYSQILFQLWFLHFSSLRKKNLSSLARTFNNSPETKNEIKKWWKNKFKRKHIYIFFLN